MSRIDDMIDGINTFIEEFNEGAVFRTVCEQCGDSMVEDVRSLLLEGKGSADELGDEDKPLLPTYDNDLKSNGGYFKSVESAHAYKRWKIEVMQSLPMPPSDSPNLYIDGTFHSSLHTEWQDKAFAVTSSAPFGEKVFAKYGVSCFGMSQVYYETIFRPVMLDRLTERLHECIE